MKTSNDNVDDNELRKLLQSYEVSGPSPELVAQVKHLMRQEVLQLAAEPSKQQKGVFVLVGLAVVMSLCFFYMLTVGTILRFVLPSSLVEVVYHTLYALTAVGSSLLAGVIMVFCFRQFYTQRVEGALRPGA